jgi:hypothetical protein
MQAVASKLPLPELRRVVFEREPKLADAARAVGPVRRGACEVGEMLFEVEARHDLVGLRLQIGAQQTSLRRGIEEG